MKTLHSKALCMQLAKHPTSAGGMNLVTLDKSLPHTSYMILDLPLYIVTSVKGLVWGCDVINQLDTGCKYKEVLKGC